MTLKDLDSWMKDGDYLPPILRDFHDQKDIFKTLHRAVDVEKHDYAKVVNWIAGQCYVIDIFLWFMAKRGYTLQRSRARLPFKDIAIDIGDTRAASRKVLSELIQSTRPTSPETGGGGM